MLIASSHIAKAVFKRRKDWVILSVTLHLESADAEELRATAERDLKDPQ